MMSETAWYVHHDDLKHAVAASLRQHSSEFDGYHTGKVDVERRILDGDRRIDVAFDRCLGGREQSYAFEVKSTLGDAVGVCAQLRDYSKANYIPILVKRSELHSGKGSEPDSIIRNAEQYAAIVSASVDDGDVEFEPISGFKSDIVLSMIADYWNDRTFSLEQRADRQCSVLAVLADGRANPYLIREETGLGKGDTNTVLNRLARAGYVEQVTRGLYEITESGERRVRDGSRG